MARDPQVDLIFNHFIPRYVATGVDPNDLNRLMARVDDWADWCRIWSDEASKHEQLGKEAAAKGRRVTAGESYLRAAIYYHYGKHLFVVSPDEYRQAHDAMLRCYTAAAPDMSPPAEHVTFPFDGTNMAGWLRRPRDVKKPGVAVKLKASPEWGRVLGAVIDVLERRGDVDGHRVGVVGQSLGALYAPLAAAGEPRLKACIANCGPFDWGTTLPKMPRVSQETFRVRSHSATLEDALKYARQFTLESKAQNIRCPLLVVFGGGDRLIAPAEGKRLAESASGPTEFVLYEEGNHVCFNISYKFRPLTADWMAETLAKRA
jgi:dienelactone hydrolase